MISTVELGEFRLGLSMQSTIKFNCWSPRTSKTWRLLQSFRRNPSQVRGLNMSFDGDAEWGSSKMKDLATQLRNYKPPPGVYGNVMQLPPPPGVTQTKSHVVVPQDVNHFPWWQRAGVLICLFSDQQMQLNVILTKRTSTLSSHSGGKWDGSETDDINTALREAHEEIGLEPSSVKVVTQLEPFISKLLLRVVPVVALMPHREKFIPKLNEAEVASMFEAPLEMFLKDENHYMGERVFLGQSYPVHYFEFDYNGERYVIWGATAAILIRAASIVFNREPEFILFNSSKL